MINIFAGCDNVTGTSCIFSRFFSGVAKKHKIFLKGNKVLLFSVVLKEACRAAHCMK